MRSSSLGLVSSVRRAAVVALVFSSALASGGAWAATVSVAPTDDLVALVAAANDGDVFELQADTYSITSALVLSAQCTVKGQGIDKTVIKQTEKCKHVLEMRNAGAVIEGCNLTGVSYNVEKREGCAVVIPSTGGGTIRTCRITGNYSGTNRGYGVALNCHSTDGVITNCVIDSNTCSTGATTDNWGVYMTAGTMDHCLVRNNDCTNTGGLYVGGSAKIRWCTIAGNCPTWDTFVGGGILLASDGAVFENCVIAGNTAKEKATGAGKPEIGCNSYTATFTDCVFPKSVTLPSGVLGTPLQMDVLYIDAANKDYRQKLSSPAKDYGYYTPYDYSGDLRCESTVTHTAMKSGETITFNGYVAGTNAGDTVTYLWTITKPDKSTDTRTNLTDTYSPTAAGDYTARLSVAKNGGTPVLAPDTHTFKVIGSEMTVETAADLMAIVNDYNCDGLTLTLQAKTYEINRTLSINNSITIHGAGMDKTIIKMTATGPRGILINHADALVENLTVQGAYTTTEARHGAGVQLTKAGTLRNCRITGNRTNKNNTYGCGVAIQASGALVTHCVIDRNVVPEKQAPYYNYGGGVYITSGTLDNCLVYKNDIDVSNSSRGGGIYATGGTVQNCTVVANVADTGGGIYQSGTPTVRNCIFANNVTLASDTAVGKPEWCGGNVNMTHCLFPSGTVTNSTIGGTHVLGDPAFADAANDDYHPLGSAASVNRGIEYADMASTDLDGFTRISGDIPDIGCYEFDSDTVTVSFSVPNGGSGFLETKARFEANVTGTKAGDTVAYAWTLIDNRKRKTVSTDSVFDFAPTNCGLFTAELLVSVNGGKPIPYALTNCYLVCPHVVYVKEPTDENAAAAEMPYESWETAGTNLAEAVGMMLSGGAVRLAEGTHPLYAKLMVDKAVEISGAGIDRSVVRAKHTNASILYVDHASAVVSNLTLTGFFANTEVVNEGERQMGAVVIGTHGGTIDTCRITGNRYTASGLGVNHSCGVGVRLGGANARVTRCIIDRNKGSCSQYTDMGGGVYGVNGLLENCLVCCNTNYSGGGVGVAGGTFTVRNCTIVDNVATSPDTSSDHGTWGGGGIFVRYGTLNLVNTIVHGNTCPGVPSTDELRNVDTSKAVTCCFADPLFENRALGNYRIRACSPACRKGTKKDAPTDDLERTPRRNPRRVDIGCYENPTGPGLLILVR